MSGHLKLVSDCCMAGVLCVTRHMREYRVHNNHNNNAWRRRQRRLRSWWRHEQQSVAMAAAHHSYDKVAAGEQYHGPRAQKTDRAWEAANKALRRQMSKAAGDAVFFELFDEDTAGCAAWGSRRTSAAGTGPAAHLGAYC